eukprot:1237009-Rhodomonas_salina.1
MSVHRGRRVLAPLLGPPFAASVPPNAVSVPPYAASVPHSRVGLCRSGLRTVEVPQRFMSKEWISPLVREHVPTSFRFPAPSAASVPARPLPLAPNAVSTTCPFLRQIVPQRRKKRRIYGRGVGA